jgi:hypothetical protein
MTDSIDDTKQDVLGIVALGGLLFTLGLLVIATGMFIYQSWLHPFESFRAIITVITFFVSSWFIINYIFAEPLGTCIAKMLAPVIVSNVIAAMPQRHYPVRAHRNHHVRYP